MAFTPSGASVKLLVTDEGQTASLSGASTQVRIWNEGPNSARVRYGVGGSLTAADTDMVIPPGLIEIHSKANATAIAAKCATGETATLHVIVGAGD